MNTSNMQHIEKIKENIQALFCDSEGRGYAFVIYKGRNTTLAIESRDMRDFIVGLLYKEMNEILSIDQTEKVKSALLAEARFDNPVYEVSQRVSRTEKGIEIDLNNDGGECILITDEGWSIAQPESFFYRPNGMRELPRPVKGGSFESFKDIINVSSDDDLKLLLISLSYYLNGKGPYPILTFKGPEGCGKSTGMRVCKRLIDPSKGEDRAYPENERDLFIAAKSEHLYALDNVSNISSKQSDALCRLATGASYGRKKNYTDDDEHLIRQCNPIIINGITDLAKRPDLVSRTISISLRPFDYTLDEETFWSNFSSKCPELIGYILSIAHAGYANYGKVSKKSSTRLSDFERWGRACELGLGWEEGAFLRIFQKNQDSTLEIAISNDPVAVAILRMLDEKKDFTGTATELLSELSFHRGYEERPKNWPTTAQYLSETLNRLERSFRKVGIEYVNYEDSGLSNNKNKVLILRKIEDEGRDETPFSDRSVGEIPEAAFISDDQAIYDASIFD